LAPVWSGRLSQGPDALVLEYCSGRDVAALPMADQALLPCDIWGTEAHGLMLVERGILRRDDGRAILGSLRALRALVEAGSFALDPAKEDVHMNVESFVTERCGAEAGRRVHTGRSRNDQVATDMRLHVRAALLGTAADVASLCRALLERGRAEAATVMPGYSHTRHATISTFGHLLVSYAQALLRDVGRFVAAYDVVNSSPLGAAAGFGTSWPIDRERTAALLGFDRVQLNTIDCVSSRWETEAEAAAAFSFLMTHLALMAQDLIFLSTAEAGMVRLDDAVVQGSSIMPQKRNPDVLEVTRAKAALAHSSLQSLLTMGRGGISGYNRDMQYTKYVVMDLLRECGPAPAVMERVLMGLLPDRARMKSMAGRDFLNAVDVADHLCRALGLPFRQAYSVVAAAVHDCESDEKLTAAAVNTALAAEGVAGRIKESEFAALEDPSALVGAKNHAGGPAPTALQAAADALQLELADLDAGVRKRSDRIAAAWKAKEAAVEALLS
jgi:argininosuccinate lyase